MAERIDVEINDKVQSSVSGKLKAIAAAAREAGTSVDRLKSRLDAINTTPLDKLADASAKLTNALARETNAQARLTAATTKATTVDGLAAVAQQKLATEVAKTATQQAKLATAQSQATAASARAEAALNRHTGTTKTHTTAQNSATKSLGLSSHEWQNLSFQINDAITMLASGSSAMRVVATQGGQVFQIFQTAGGRLNTTLLTTLGLFALFAVATLAAIGLVKKWADEFNHLSQAAKIAGIAVSDLTKMQQIANKTLDGYDVNSGMTEFAKKVREAAESENDLYELLKKNEIPLKTATGAARPLLDIFRDVAVLIADSKNEIDKLILAEKLGFGKDPAAVEFMTKWVEAIRAGRGQLTEAEKETLKLKAAAAEVSKAWKGVWDDFTTWAQAAFINVLKSLGDFMHSFMATISEGWNRLNATMSADPTREKMFTDKANQIANAEAVRKLTNFGKDNEQMLRDQLNGVSGARPLTIGPKKTNRTISGLYDKDDNGSSAEKRASALAKVNRELDTELARMGMLKPEREIQQAMDHIENQLASKKIKLSEDERASILKKIQTIQALRGVQQELDKIYDETIGKQRELENTTTALNAAFEKGIITASDLQNRLVQLGVAQADLNLKLGTGGGKDVITSSLGRMVQGYQGVLPGLSASFGDFFNTINRGFADSIGRAIASAESLDDALRSVAQNALAQIISSLIQLGTQWVINQVLAQTLGTSATGTSIAQAALVASAWAPAAALASLATLGSNAVAAGAALTGTTALAQGLALVRGFKSGGWTGGAARDEVSGVVHGQEFVVNAEATRRNRDLLEAINGGMDVAKQAYMNGGYVEPNYSTRSSVGTSTATPGAGKTVIIRPTIVTKSPEEFRRSERQTAAQMARMLDKATKDL